MKSASLAARFGASVVTDEAGLRAIPAERSRMYLAARRVEAEAREAQRAAEAAARPNDALQLRERVRRIAARREPAADGVTAYEVMVSNDPQKSMAKSSRNLDDDLSGGLTYRRYTDPEG